MRVLEDNPLNEAIPLCALPLEPFLESSELWKNGSLHPTTKQYFVSDKK